MSLVEEIKKEQGSGWLPDIYRSKVRPQRTRAFDLSLPSKEHRVEIVHTLLGIQIKTGGKLIGCPDLSTARYLRVFARIGCEDVAVPYDITKISSVADELDSSWHNAILILNQKTEGSSVQTSGRHRAAMIRKMRTEIGELGSGVLMPKFDTETKQRNT